MRMITRSKRRQRGEDVQAHQGAFQASTRAVNLEAELAQLGFLPRAADPVLYRGLGKNGFGLFLYLETALSLQTLNRLGDCTDIAALLTEAAARFRS
jgi:hypothetical protein